MVVPKIAIELWITVSVQFIALNLGNFSAQVFDYAWKFRDNEQDLVCVHVGAIYLQSYVFMSYKSIL